LPQVPVAEVTEQAERIETTVRPLQPPTPQAATLFEDSGTPHTAQVPNEVFPHVPVSDAMEHGVFM
jgi:hypothetical protein